MWNDTNRYRRLPHTIISLLLVFDTVLLVLFTVFTIIVSVLMDVNARAVSLQDQWKDSSWCINDDVIY